jgi:NADH-quinone oxidoreductase subunit N
MQIAIDFKIEDVLCVAPAILVFLASLVPLTIKIFNGNREPNTLSTLVYALIGLIGAAVVAVVVGANATGSYYFSNALVLDGLATFSTLMIVAITALCLILAREHSATNGHQFSEFVFLMMNASVGMMVLSWSNDLIVTFIGIEIMSLCLYLLIALSHEERMAKEAAFKYFLLGSFASAIFLYGVALIFGSAQTTYINEIMEMAPELSAVSYIFLMGIVLAILGFCFKVAIVPFHAWTPDVYEGSPTPVTAYMASGVKLVTFIAFLRLVAGDYLATELSGNVVEILQWLAVFTMLVGNIAAILQNNLKRMLAYSSIAHSGYALMGVLASAVGGTNFLGASGVVYYVMAYSIMTIGALGVVCLLEKEYDSIILVDDLSGLAKRNPWAAFCFTVFLLSLAGMPPTVGFFAKLFIFSAAIKQGFFWLAVWGVIASAISVYYYLRPIVLMYMKEEAGVSVATHYKLSHVTVTLMAAFVLLFGLFTSPVYDYVSNALNTLM